MRQGVRQITVSDDDRVEAHNIRTQVYAEGDVGPPKAEVLCARCFRAAGIELEGERQSYSFTLRDLAINWE